MTMLVLLMAALGAEPTGDRFVDGYGSLASFRALECIEDWMQICSPPAGPWLDVRIYGQRVEVTTSFPGDDLVVFKIVRRSPQALELAFDRCVPEYPDCVRVGQGLTARLELNSGGRATWVGPVVERVYDRMEGAARGVVRVELIRNALYSARIRELERRYVPGGKCEGLGGYQVVGGKPCINAPGKKSR
jgi:hypothetical protein